MAHGIPYVAQASPHNFRDLISKAETGVRDPGPGLPQRALAVPARLALRTDAMGMTLAKMMVQSCCWPLYEVVDGEYSLNYDPKKRKIPVVDWMKLQGRFNHLFKPGNEAILEAAQAYVDSEWEKLKALAAAGGAGTDDA